MAGSSLFYSEILEGKKESLKKLCFTLKKGLMCTFLEVWDECLTRNKCKRYWGCSFLKTLQKKQSFLYQRRKLRGSKPNSSYSYTPLLSAEP